MRIDPRAIVDPVANLADDVVVGPFSIIQAGVTIGANTVIGPHVVIESGTTVGVRCRIGSGAKLGGAPQDVSYAGGTSYLSIGDECDIRELAVIHRSAVTGGCTKIGSHNFIMSQAHIAHDCVLGDHVVVASMTALAGHVEVEDWAVVGGVTGVHQFVRIGTHSIVGGASRLIKDAPPYMRTAGNPAMVRGVNTVGLRRAGFAPQQRKELKDVYRLLYRSDLNIKQVLATLRCQPPLSAPVAHLVRFIERSKRGLCSSPRRSSSHETEGEREQWNEN